MSVAGDLSERDRELARWFGRHGFERPYLVVAAMRKAKIKPQTAAALLDKESFKGRNIFGCDHGTVDGDHPPYCRHNVTERRARRLRGSTYSNGVGPAQLTYKPLVDRARERGGEWKPYVNMWTGFEYYRQQFEATGSHVNAGARYNGGPSPNEDARRYGRDFAQRRRRWERELREAGFRV